MKRALLFLAVCVLGVAASCAAWVREGLDPATMPVEVQPDYALFALRCSKCHSLARPLTSGIEEDDYWVDYVARMRRQPASGISAEDTVGILRFLHYFSMEEKRKHGRLPPTVAVVATPAPPPAASTGVPPQPPPPPPLPTPSAVVAPPVDSAAPPPPQPGTPSRVREGARP